MLNFLEHRLGLLGVWRCTMTHKRLPQGIGFLRCLGFAALTVLFLQFCSGIALAFHYVPTTGLAYDSIRALEQDVAYGTLSRSLHHFGASAAVILLGLHMLRVFFSGAYKAPRELTWVSGVILFCLVLGFGFTGYLLPWDQKAYFATKVGTEIAGKAPMLGDSLRQALNGGDTVGAPTLTRFYIIHVLLLPLGLLAVLGIHLFLIQRHGIAAPQKVVGDEGEKGLPYFPHHVFKEALLGVLVAAVLFVLASSFRAPLEALADPADGGYDPRPDWYFLAMFQLLKVFQGPWESLGSFWLPNLLLLGLLLLPFVDRGKQRHWRRRPWACSMGVLLVVLVLAFTYTGARDKADNAAVLPYPLGYSETEKHGYLLLRQLRCMECHQHQDPVSGQVYGSRDEDAPDAPDLEDLEGSPDDIAEIMEDPLEVLGSEDMPDFAHIQYEDRRAVGIFLQRFRRDLEGD